MNVKIKKTKRVNEFTNRRNWITRGRRKEKTKKRKNRVKEKCR